MAAHAPNECVVDGGDGKRTDKPVSIDRRLHGRADFPMEKRHGYDQTLKEIGSLCEIKILTIRDSCPQRIPACWLRACISHGRARRRLTPIGANKAQLNTITRSAAISTPRRPGSYPVCLVILGHAVCSLPVRCGTQNDRPPVSRLTNIGMPADSCDRIRTPKGECFDP